LEPNPAAETPQNGARADLLSRVVASALQGSPRAVVLSAPRGHGKGRLLDDAAAALQSAGLLVARIDLGRAVTNPDEVACSLAAALLLAASEGAPLMAIPGPSGLPSPSAAFRALATADVLRDLPRSSEIVESLGAEISRRRGDGRRVVSLALDLAAALVVDLDRPVAIAARRLDEIGRLVHFPGLHDAPELFARFLSRAGSVRLIGGTSPGGRPRPLLDALSKSMGGDMTVLGIPSPGLEEIAASAKCPVEEARGLLAITGGRSLTLGVLSARMRAGLPLEEALGREFSPEEGRLVLELRFDYHQLLERTRGYAASRAILNILAREEGLDLTGIARRLRRSVGSTLDYLRWLAEVALLRREGRRYLFVDPLLRLHILIHEAPERPEDPAGRRAVIHRFLTDLGGEPAPLRPRGRPPGAIADASSARRRRAVAPASARTRPAARDEAPRTRHDPMIEID
jgi:hypothetical protein